MQGGSKVKTKSQGHKAFVQSRKMPTKAVRTLKKSLETGQRREGDKEIKSQMRGEAIAQCIGMLQLSLLGEDWREHHRNRVADPKGHAHVVDLEQHHRDQADFHKAKVEKYAAKHTATKADRSTPLSQRSIEVHQWNPNSKRKGKRHLTLFRAHEKAAADYGFDPSEHKNHDPGAGIFRWT